MEPRSSRGGVRYPVASNSLFYSNRVDMNQEKINAELSSIASVPVDHSQDAKEDSKPEAIDQNSAEHRIMYELNQLSEAERQRVVQDVEGNSSCIMPYPLPSNMNSIDLDALDRGLQRLKMNTEYSDIEQALMSDVSKDPSLRRQMLLAECHNTEAAAIRLISFLRLLRDILGPSTHRSVTLADLSEQERHLQRKGTLQLFKFRDTAGRRVVGCFETGTPCTLSLASQLKVMTYLFQAAAEDEASQELGLVFIFMLGKAPASADDSNVTLQALSRIVQCAPVRVGAFHICSPDRPEFHTAKNNIVNSLSRQERLRTRIHHGTTMECSSALNGFGIPTDRLPLKYDGSIKLDDHLQWIAVREAKEEAHRQGKAFDVIECPLNMDILAGRGQLIRSHPGNVSFRQDFIHVRMACYNKAFNREAKNDVANSVLEDIAGMQRRFLKQHATAGYWTELNYKTAKEKVMMAFREYRKVQKSNAAAASAAAVPPAPTSPVRAIAPVMVAEGYRRPIHSPISISRSNSNLSPPVDQQLQHPMLLPPPAGDFPDRHVHSHPSSRSHGSQGRNTYEDSFGHR